MSEKGSRPGDGVKRMDHLAGKYLTFALGKEEYGINILKIREIIGLMEITAVPHTPHFVKGVINLRGRVIPVVDLRLKFGLTAKEYNERTCIIVVEVQAGGGTMVQIGMIVDSVSEVLNVSGEDVDPPPSFGSDVLSTSNILGMAKVKGEVTTLLDIDQVIGAQDIVNYEDA